MTVAVLVGGAISPLMFVTRAEAGAIAVTTTIDQDDNQPPCSLREAIISANSEKAIGGCASGSGADTITLPPGTYKLDIPNDPTIPDENGGETGDLDILSELTIIGSGAANTFVDGNGPALADRVFDVNAAGIASISGITIRNGNEPTSLAGGGGVTNSGRATFTDTIITGNIAISGGGVRNGAGATSVFIDSIIVGNGVGASGGGISNGAGASSTFMDTTISKNTAQASGGGVTNEGAATFINSTLSANIAVKEGGAIFNSQGAASTLVNSTVSSNQSNEFGGGVYGGSTTLSNATVTANVADSDANGTGDGGGVAGTALTAKNSIIGGNTDSSPPPNVAPDCQAIVTSQGYNLISVNTGCTGTHQPTDVIGSSAVPIAPGLGPLADNGGATFTHALLRTSPAHNAGSPAPPGGPGDACAGTDQRGAPRPQGGRCDMGAFEAAECFNAVANRVGTPGNDVLRGTSGPDVFLGFGGNDRIKGLGGNDRACGGRGKDAMVGGKGKDRLAGGDGADRMFGGDGSDLLRGGGSADALIGGRGRDRCAGGAGRDTAATCERLGQVP